MVKGLALGLTSGSPRIYLLLPLTDQNGTPGDKRRAKSGTQSLAIHRHYEQIRRRSQDPRMRLGELAPPSTSPWVLLCSAVDDFTAP